MLFEKYKSTSSNVFYPWRLCMHVHVIVMC